MTLIRFSYSKKGGIWQPIIPIGINLDNSWQRFDVYVDSGASYSILKARLALILGFDYRTGNRISLQVGDGSLILVYVHNLEVQLGAERFVCPIGFSDNLGVPFNVLGKMGIFERFKICFDQSQKVISFSIE